MTDRRSWKVLGRLIRWNGRTMSHYYFFPNFSPATTIRIKAFNPVLKKMTSLGLQPFLIYPAVSNNYGTKGSRKVLTLLRKRRILSAPCLSRRRMPWLHGKATGKQRPLSLRPSRRAWWPGRDDGRWTWMLLNLFFDFSSLLSPTEILSLSIRYNDLFAGKTNTPFFFFGGD